MWCLIIGLVKVLRYLNDILFLEKYLIDFKLSYKIFMINLSYTVYSQVICAQANLLDDFVVIRSLS